MDTTKAVELRKHLENEILAMLLTYRAATGLTPVRVDIKDTDVIFMGGTERVIRGVRVTVEL
jgi:hypothetical protein